MLPGRQNQEPGSEKHTGNSPTHQETVKNTDEPAITAPSVRAGGWG